MRLAVVTASTTARHRDVLRSWRTGTHTEFSLFLVFNGPEVNLLTTDWRAGVLPTGTSFSPEYLGTVPAFRRGVDLALGEGADVIACLHDDFVIMEDGWDTKVIRHFERYPACGLAGFGGAIGLGDSDLYQKPYEPIQLARQGFRSNLLDAEAHGLRSLLPEPVACLDGFSQIGRREFWEGRHRTQHPPYSDEARLIPLRPWTVLEDLGIVHHFYDGALACLAKRYGWETWYIPLRGHHRGGQTAVGDPGYQAWAKEQIPGGDHGFWEQAHKAAYQAFTDVLPIRV